MITQSPKQLLRNLRPGVARLATVSLITGLATVLCVASARADANEGTATRAEHSILSAGTSHTCAVLGGAAKCWGANDMGQLGTTSSFDSFVPADVAGLSSGVAAIAAGGQHTCALTTSGGVKCWGRGLNGQLGNNGTTTKRTPVDVPDLTSGVAAITAGANHTCALTTAGGVKCWGLGTSGQLGNGSSLTQKVPVPVNSLSSGVAAITAGANHTCALTTAGAVKCWGAPDGGLLLGNGATTIQNTPVSVDGLTSGVTAVSAGDLHTCALLNTGAVRCWGRGGSGQIGNAVSLNQPRPDNDVAQLPPAMSISVGGSHACAVSSGGAALCWGYGLYGQLGNSTWTSINYADDVTGLASGVTAVTAGLNHTCAIASSEIRCWGNNASGQLGLGDNSSHRNVPGSPAAPVPSTSVAPSPSISVDVATTTTQKSPTTTTPKKSTSTTVATPQIPGENFSTTTTNSNSAPGSTPRPGITTTTNVGTPDTIPDRPSPPSTAVGLPEPYPQVSVPPGIGMDINVPDLEPGETVDCWWLDDTGTVLAGNGPFECGTADSDGRLRTVVRVPHGASGTLTLLVIGRVSKHGLRQSVLVTGNDTRSWWWVLVLTCVVALFLVFIVLRRREDEESLPTDGKS